MLLGLVFCRDSNETELMKKRHHLLSLWQETSMYLTNCYYYCNFTASYCNRTKFWSCFFLQNIQKHFTWTKNIFKKTVNLFVLGRNLWCITCCQLISAIRWSYIYTVMWIEKSSSSRRNGKYKSPNATGTAWVPELWRTLTPFLFLHNYFW